MIDKQALTDFVESRLAGTDCFLVEVRVSPANEIVVEVDSPCGVDIDCCCALSREIEEAFPREKEDYSLEVGSAGLTAPFKVRGQYLKNVGGRVEVLTADSRKLKGVLDEVDDDGFTLVVETKVREPGMKRPVVKAVPHRFVFADVRKVCALLDF